MLKIKKLNNLIARKKRTYCIILMLSIISNLAFCVIVLLHLELLTLYVIILIALTVVEYYFVEYFITFNNG